MASRKLGQWCAVVVCAGIGGFFAAGVAWSAYAMVDYLIRSPVEWDLRVQLVKDLYRSPCLPHPPFIPLDVYHEGGIPYWLNEVGWLVIAAVMFCGTWLLCPRRTTERDSGGDG